jgi:hypothetical protein
MNALPTKLQYFFIDGPFVRGKFFPHRSRQYVRLTPTLPESVTGSPCVPTTLAAASDTYGLMPLIVYFDPPARSCSSIFFRLNEPAV